MGRLIAEQGLEIVLTRYAIETVCDYGTFGELLHKRLRWMVVMRHMRAWGHLHRSFYPGLAAGDSRRSDTSFKSLGCVLSGRVYVAQNGHGLDNWHPRSSATRPLERIAADSGLEHVLWESGSPALPAIPSAGAVPIISSAKAASWFRRLPCLLRFLCARPIKLRATGDPVNISGTEP